jgi:flavodoxin I
MFRLDDSDLRYLIAYEEKHEHSVAPYQQLMHRWVARFERGGSFGVILVNGEDSHDEDEAHDHAEAHDVAAQRDVAFEEAFTALLNDFRRDHKADVERCTVGFARVLPRTWLDEQLAANPNLMDDLNANWDRMARYMWGVPGRMCVSVEEARIWLDEQMAAFTPPASDAPSAVVMPSGGKVGLFYGSTTGMTEVSALKIQAVWAAHGMEPITAVNIGTVKDLSVLLNYDHLILGIPTWNVGQLQDDWAIAMPHLDALDFTGRQVALFGVGDQYGYPDNYLDAVGMLGAKLVERGAALVGKWSADGYEFAASKALVDGQFMGLALDEEHQAEMSERRIDQWVEQLIGEFALQPAAQETK